MPQSVLVHEGNKMNIDAEVFESSTKPHVGSSSVKENLVAPHNEWLTVNRRRKPKSRPDSVQKSKDTERDNGSHFRDLQGKDNDAVTEIGEQNLEMYVVAYPLRMHGKSGNVVIKRSERGQFKVQQEIGK